MDQATTREAYEAEKRRKAEERRAAIAKRIDEAFAAVRSAVEAAGATWESNGGWHHQEEPGWHNVRVNGTAVSLRIEEAQQNGSWTNRGTGRLFASYDNCGSKKTRPEAKGGLKAAEIAADLIAHAAWKARSMEADEKVRAGREESYKIVTRLAEAHGRMTEYGTADIADVRLDPTAAPDKVLVQVALFLTEEKASRLIEAVKAVRA